MNILKFLIVSLLVSQIFAIGGGSVNCLGSGCASPTNCPTPPTVTPHLTMTWGTGIKPGTCMLSACPEGVDTFTGATDIYCQSCPGVSITNTPAVYANTLGNACVAASATCGSGRTANTWTDADCLACNGNTSQYAKTDQSGCQATAPSSSPSPSLYSNSMIILSSVLSLITFLF
ncbi:cell surface immobilization antigen (macronuclear) [Tetrahymena thermophila SB210]|uniref:Cell surface immobilization antigen n=1 Tax=Tetrahymena thermophila (strain SB210) TaxID=312017 RepID=Q235S8_TETTS|nr:cell surface immobilization antigen [Tetrahymena thermophila SB210]EAR92278.2 cell surface immobilization antigen [Tetrahymena thermophila SB210]|eukprot:XP_001012523.2 cell surface immobilization antigen [Tetrahymena thermophila SB210]